MLFLKLFDFCHKIIAGLSAESGGGFYGKDMDLHFTGQRPFLWSSADPAGVSNPASRENVADSALCRAIR